MRSLHALPCLLACVAAGGVGSGAGSAGASATCTASQLHAGVLGSTGAAGTIAVSITLKNVGSACTLHGYAGLQLRNAGGPLPTTVIHGGLSVLMLTPHTVHLAHNGKATLLIAYNHVPSGTTPCPTATRLLIRPPGASGQAHLALRLDPCRHGRIYEAPILAGLHHAP